MNGWLATLTVAAMLIGLPGPAPATMLFDATLEGTQEVPPNASPATGFGTVLLDDPETSILASLSFADLLAPQIAAHIHGPAAPGVNAAVLFPLPLGQVSTQSFSITPTQVGFLKTGLLYFNVHSTIFPGGEIRGQILPAAVGEPGTLLSLGAALVGLGGLTWTRRRRMVARRPLTWLECLPSSPKRRLV